MPSSPATDVAVNPPTCPKCRAQVTPGANACSECGCFLPANKAARQSGAYARTPSAEVLRGAMELCRGIVADLGGESELSTLEKSYVRKLGDLQVQAQLLSNELNQQGPLTPSGASVRSTFDAWITVLGTFDRYAQRIGHQRRGRRVASLADYLQQHPQPPDEEEPPSC